MIAGLARDPKEIRVMRHDDPLGGASKLQMGLIVAGAKPGFRSRRDVGTVATKGVGDRRIDVFVEMKANPFSHG
jgi:hypothetical protein